MSYLEDGALGFASDDLVFYDLDPQHGFGLFGGGLIVDGVGWHELLDVDVVAWAVLFGAMHLVVLHLKLYDILRAFIAFTKKPNTTKLIRQ